MTKGTRQNAVGELLAFIQTLVEQKEYTVLEQLLDRIVYNSKWEATQRAVARAKDQLRSAAQDECDACKTRLFCRACSVRERIAASKVCGSSS